jgi:hypothetical protein
MKLVVTYGVLSGKRPRSFGYGSAAYKLHKSEGSVLLEPSSLVVDRQDLLTRAYPIPDAHSIGIDLADDPLRTLFLRRQPSVGLFNDAVDAGAEQTKKNKGHC